jgi:hypothetical protein
MIPVSVLLALFGLAALLTVIPFIDNRNRIYGNIVMFAIATITWFLLAFFMVTGSVGDNSLILSSTNLTANITNMTYGVQATAFTSGTLMYLFILMGIVTAAYGIFAVLEAVIGPITASEEES